MNNTYKLIALDMDGTLLTSAKTISPDTVRDIQSASDAGLHVVYCTGRAVPELKAYFPVVPMMRYAVCNSGAVVYDHAQGRSIACHAIDSSFARRVVHAAAQHHAMIHFLTEGESIVSSSDITHMADFHVGIYQSMFQEIARQVPDMIEEAELCTSIAKINLYFPSAEERSACYVQLRTLPLSFAFPEATTLEMTAPHVNKATGLAELAAHLGLTLHETAVIGDSDNDREMLRCAGFSAAMGNAAADIKALCTYVTQDNDHNGVGNAIRHILTL